MAKTTKRNVSGKSAHKDEVLSRRATQHHDFIGAAEPERKLARAQEEARIEKDRAALEKEVVHEMEQKLEQEAGLRGSPGPAPQATHQEGPRGFLESLRQKAEERLHDLPRPLQSAIELTGKAAALVRVSVRFGLGVASAAVRTPMALFRMLGRTKREA